MISLVSGVFGSNGLLADATSGLVNGLSGEPGPLALLAQSAPSGSGGMFAMGNILPILLMFGIFYMLLIRPQQKRQRELQEWLKSISKGDEVVTTGGLWGKVSAVSEKSPYVTLDYPRGSGNPALPVWSGEIQCRGLGMAVDLGEHGFLQLRVLEHGLDDHVGVLHVGQALALLRVQAQGRDRRLGDVHEVQALVRGELLQVDDVLELVEVQFARREGRVRLVVGVEVHDLDVDALLMRPVGGVDDEVELLRAAVGGANE